MNSNFTDLKIYLGAVITFFFNILSQINADVIKDYVTIFVGLSTVGYTLWRWYQEIKSKKDK